MTRPLPSALGALFLIIVFAPRSAEAALGSACATSAECGTGLTCVLANSTTFDGEGAAKGYCTANCTLDASICAQFDPTALCLSFSNQEAYCFEGCTFGPPGLTQFDPNKCRGRTEVACRPFFDDVGNFTVSACHPQCNSDTDCGGGLSCNPRTGTCTSTPPAGKGLGETCVQVADGGVEQCQGTCIGFVHSSGQNPFTYMCAESCTLGALPSCGWDPTTLTPAPGACLFVSTTILDNGGAGIGDQASCGQLCDCNSDCKNPDLVCTAWTGSNAQTLASFYARAGFCSDPLQEDGSVNPGLCPTDAGTGGGSGTGGTGGSGTGGSGTGATGAGGIGPDGGALGGGPGFGGSGNADAGLPAQGNSSSGCGCRTARLSVSPGALLGSALLVLLAFGRRRVWRY
jgi:hypothetical protein